MTGNRENWEVASKHNIWGVPKRSKGLHSRIKIGDSIMIYARSDKCGNVVLPSAIMGEYKVTELFEDTTPLFTTPPQMGDEGFPFRFRLKSVKIFKEKYKILKNYFRKIKSNIMPHNAL